MNTTVILYGSKYGATKKYAQWLGQELGCDIIETKAANIKDVVNYDTIVLGGGIYAGGVYGLSFLTGHIDALKNKEILVFGVGAAPYHDDYIKKIKDQNIKDKLQEVPFFYCRGAWDEQLFTLKDKLLIKMFKKMLSKKDKTSMPDYQREMAECLHEKQDWTDKNNLNPIIKYLKNKTL